MGTWGIPHAVSLSGPNEMIRVVCTAHSTWPTVKSLINIRYFAQERFAFGFKITTQKHGDNLFINTQFSISVSASVIFSKGLWSVLDLGLPSSSSLCEFHLYSTIGTSFCWGSSWQQEAWGLQSPYSAEGPAGLPAWGKRQRIET